MITVENVSYTYPGTAVPAVQEISFTIQPGEIFGFLGPSGAGKSTTQTILTGLRRGYRGAVTVLGRELGAWGRDYYQRIGVSFELPNHFLKLTARENLAYFGALYERPLPPVADLLAQVGLAEAADMVVAQFSKGMKNRLTLARALLHNPDLLFLDEPTAGLDPGNARRIRDLIRAQQAAGKTIFLTTHDMMVADTLCDRVAFIVDGAIQLIAPPHQLKRQYGRPVVRVEYGAAENGRWAQQEFPLAELGQDAAFRRLLQQHPIATIHSQEATLEDIFIQVTGQALL